MVVESDGAASAAATTTTTLIGTAGALATALEAEVYGPAPHCHGPGTLKLSLGRYGGDNDSAPTIDVPVALAAQEECAPLAVSLGDADVAEVACSGVLVAALSVAHGMLSLGVTTADVQRASPGVNGTLVIAGVLGSLDGAHAQLSLSEDAGALALGNGGKCGRVGAHDVASTVAVTVV